MFLHGIIHPPRHNISLWRSRFKAKAGVFLTSGDETGQIYSSPSEPDRSSQCIPDGSTPPWNYIDLTILSFVPPPRETCSSSAVRRHMHERG